MVRCVCGDESTSMRFRKTFPGIVHQKIAEKCFRRESIRKTLMSRAELFASFQARINQHPRLSRETVLVVGRLVLGEIFADFQRVLNERQMLTRPLVFELAKQVIDYQVIDNRVIDDQVIDNRVIDVRRLFLQRVDRPIIRKPPRPACQISLPEQESYYEKCRRTGVEISLRECMVCLSENWDCERHTLKMKCCRQNICIDCVNQIIDSGRTLKCPHCRGKFQIAPDDS